MEDLLQLQNGDDTSETNEEEEFHKRFVAEIKRKEFLDKLQQQNNQIIFNDEDDKFIMDYEKDEEEAESFLEREKRKAEKKELKLVDHSTTEFEKIRKNLYIETKEISKMTDKEVSEFRKSQNDIKVRGLKCPKPIQNWYQCGLPDPVLEKIEKKQFKMPFPI